jgi:MoxR-like ATPase
MADSPNSGTPPQAGRAAWAPVRPGTTPGPPNAANPFGVPAKALSAEARSADAWSANALSAEALSANGGPAAAFPAEAGADVSDGMSAVALPVAAEQGPVVAEATLSDTEHLEKTLAAIPERFNAVRTELAKAIVGQDENIEAAFYALLSRGHCLIVGVPGLAKTLLVQALARVLRLGFKRVQFTPDLMPADITGTTIFRADEAGNRQFVFVPGPVFTQLLLADEINRTPPKTQAALLEAMQERTVTASGQTFQLEEPFFVFATQNPIEQEGTYPLPEAQLDRFLFELRVGYPSLEDERRIVSGHSFRPLDQLTQILSREEILRFRDAVARIPASPAVIDFAVRIVRATRPDAPNAAPHVKRWLKWGASPRASQNLILAGRARAACLGRFNVSIEDIQTLAPLVLRHRVLRTFHAEAEGQSTDAIVARIVEDTPR